MVTPAGILAVVLTVLMGVFGIGGAIAGIVVHEERRRARRRRHGR